MKQETKLQRWVPSALFGLILAGSTGTVVALDDYLVDDFSEGNVDNVKVTDTGPSGAMVNSAIVSYDASVGNPAGSCYVELDWPLSDGGNWEACRIDWNPPGWPGTDISVYANAEFDVKVDTTTPPCADGSYGQVGVACQSWTDGGWNGLASMLLTNGSGWQHYKASLASLPSPYHLNRFNISFDGGPPNSPTNTIKLWVDNVKLTAPPAYVPSPTLAIQTQPRPLQGLHLFASVPDSTYQRQSIRTVDTSYTWYNQSSPVTYSLNIAEFPLGGRTNYTEPFNAAVSASSWWFWWGGGDVNSVSFAWDGTTPDASGTCTNGSLKVSVPFTGASGEQFSIAGNFNDASCCDKPPEPLDKKYDALVFDIQVDPSSGPVLAGTDYGKFDGIGFISPTWGQITVGTYTVPLTATNWTHVSLPFTRTLDLTGIHGFWFKMWSDNTHTNPLVFRLDNVQLHAAPNFFQVHMYLVPGPRTGTGSSPDWNETNCVFVQIQADAYGQAAAAFRYKTNYPNSNGGTNIISVVTNANCTVTTNTDQYFGACVLANITNGPVLGTWSVVFHNNSEVTFSGPGASTNFTIPPEILDAIFANGDGTMLVYYGVDSNGTNGIGQAAVLSRAVITNANFTPSIDDNFSAPALDTATWAISADAASGVFVVPSDAKGWLTWTLPDAGFGLQSSIDVANKYSWSAPAFSPFLNKNVRQVLIGPVYDTEMTQLDVSGGTLPAGVMVRESPTKASVGQTSIRALSGGTYQINSFFDVFTEVSTDSGATWWPATNGPVSMTLSGTSATNTLPPLDLQYVSSVGSQGRYANDIVITNVMHNGFTASYPPPGGFDPVESFSSTVTLDVSTDGGLTFTTYSAPAEVTVSISLGTTQGRFFRLMKPGS